MGNAQNSSLDEEFTKPVKPLTDQEIELVKECWNGIAVKEDLGMTIMIR